MKFLSLLVVAFTFGVHFNVSAHAADIWWPGADYPKPNKTTSPDWL